MESIRVARQRVNMFACMNENVAGALIPTTALMTVHTGNRVENAELNFWNAVFSTGAGLGAGAAASADARVTTDARRAVTAFDLTIKVRSAPRTAPRAMPTADEATVSGDHRWPDVGRKTSGLLAARWKMFAAGRTPRAHDRDGRRARCENRH